MIKVVIIYLIIIGISILVGFNIRIENANNSLIKGTICEGEICPPQEKYKE